LPLSSLPVLSATHHPVHSVSRPFLFPCIRFGVLDSMNDFKGRGAAKAPYPVGSAGKTRSSTKVA